MQLAILGLTVVAIVLVLVAIYNTRQALKNQREMNRRLRGGG